MRKELEVCGIECYPQKEFDEDMEDKSDNDKIRVRDVYLLSLVVLHVVISSLSSHDSHYVCPIKSVFYRRPCPLQWWEVIKNTSSMANGFWGGRRRGEWWRVSESLFFHSVMPYSIIIYFIHISR